MLTFLVELKQNTLKDPPDNCNFWKTIKPYFSNKGLNLNKLLWKQKLSFFTFFSDKKELPLIVNNFFLNITKALELKEDSKGNPKHWNTFLKHSSLTQVLKNKKSYQYN